jgi:hypothetical protein
MGEAEQVGRALGGRMSGKSWICFCPAHDNTKTPALSVTDGPDGRLLVKCHAVCSGRDVMAALQHRGIIDGMGHKAQTPSAAQMIKRKAEDHRRDEQRLQYAHDLFTAGICCDGTPVQTFLEDVRGIKGLRFNKMKNTLRFHPAVMHTPTEQILPAMLAQIRDHKGRPLGIHRTYLLPDGSGKADVQPNKMMLGQSSGGAVRFGPDGPVIALAEGIETALSISRASRLTVWASLSTSGLKGIILPPIPVGEVIIICADNDIAGLGAARTVAERLESGGRVVSIIHPKQAGADFNDVLQGAK